MRRRCCSARPTTARRPSSTRTRSRRSSAWRRRTPALARRLVDCAARRRGDGGTLGYLGQYGAIDGFLESVECGEAWRAELLRGADADFEAAMGSNYSSWGGATNKHLSLTYFLQPIILNSHLVAPCGRGHLQVVWDCSASPHPQLLPSVPRVCSSTHSIRSRRATLWISLPPWLAVHGQFPIALDALAAARPRRPRVAQAATTLWLLWDPLRFTLRGTAAAVAAVCRGGDAHRRRLRHDPAHRILANVNAT